MPNSAESPKWQTRDCENDKLVFSDVIMPGEMNGVDLGRAVRDLWPRLPVLLTTGYAGVGADAVAVEFLRLKPYDTVTLLNATGNLVPTAQAPA